MKRATQLLLTALMAACAYAQTAQVGGAILDSTQAVVPNAAVNAVHRETGVSRSTVSNGRGIYIIPSLPPGTYSIQVQKQGFRPASQPGITLEIGQIAKLDFELAVGDITQSVDVQAAPPLLQTSDPSQGQVIANKQIVELPLNGRNYTQLILLSNGASPPDPGTRGGFSGFSSNGQRSYQNNFMLDGIDNNSSLLALQSDSFQVIQPNIDALQEFKVQTNAYSAEFGRGAGAVINVAIKSGTNQYHGTLFEFLRNNAIEANSFFNNRSGVPRPAFRQNQFGGTFGGPIVRDKAFFFGDYQGARIRRASTQNSLVPTPLERRGDFSQSLVAGRVQPIHDPASYSAASNTRAPFPGNAIPADRFDPVGRSLTEIYPLPNTTGAGSNYISNFPSTDDVDQFDLRGDFHPGTNDHIFARYSDQRQPIVYPPALPPPAAGPGLRVGTRKYDSKSVVLGYTRIFTPALLNELRLGYTRLVVDWLTVNTESLNEKFGIRGTTPGLPGLANFGITGYTTLGDNTFLPNLTRANNYAISDVVHWNRGAHDITFGGSIRQVQSTILTMPQTRGAFAFTGNFTRQTSPLGGGNGLADFQLGIPTNATLSGLSHAFYLRNPFGLFVQDGWRVSPRLTLNLGLRYERSPWYHDRYGNIANLLPQSGSSLPRLFTRSDPESPHGSLTRPDNMNFAPRIGLAYQFTNKTVLRAGYGIFYGGEEQVGGGVMLHANPPFNTTSAFPTNSIAPNLLLRTGFPAGATQNAPNRPTLNAYTLDNPTPYGQQWNFTLERQVGGDWVITAGYVGSNSVHLYQSFQINAPPPGLGDLNSRRPIPLVQVPPFGIIPIGNIVQVEPRGLANYHSLQLKAEKRYSNGLFVLASWIWSKSIDYAGIAFGDGTSGGINNNSDLRSERGRSSFDTRQRLVLSYGYDLPFGKGRKFQSGAQAPVDFLIGGWQVQGITSLRTGLPFTVSATGNVSNTQSGARPDLIGDMRLPGGERSIDRWFDIGAFRPQAAFTFGNAGRDLISAPGQISVDFSMFKNFRVRERYTVQFRAEVFNLPNHANFGPPDSVLGTRSIGTINSTLTSPRQYQFALKFLF